MQPRIHIGDLHVRYRGPGAAARRRELDEAAVCHFPAALERALGELDDGRIVVVRRLETRARLRFTRDAASLARAWAEQIAGDVRAAVAASREPPAPDGNGPVVVFEGPIALLAHYVAHALEGRLDRWFWQPESGALAEARRALSALPGSDGVSHAYATAPPVPGAPSAAQAVEWALVTAGAALPELVYRLAARAPVALSLLSPTVAARLGSALAGPEGAPPPLVAPPLGPRPPASPQASLSAAPRSSAQIVAAVVAPIAATVSAWPAPDPGDPRNVLLLVALAVAAHPSLRGAAGLVGGARAALVDRAVAVQQAARSPVIAPVPAPSASDHPLDAEATAAARMPAAPVAAALSAAPAAAAPVAPTGIAPAPPIERPTAPSPPAENGGHELIPWRTALPTRFAGVFFVLDLVRALEIPAAILDEPELAVDPGLGAILYLAACALTPEAWSDPAALALAGSEAPAVPATAPSDARAAAVTRALARVDAAAARLPAALLPSDREILDERAAALPLPLRPPAWPAELCAAFALRLGAALRARIACDWPLDVLADRVLARGGLLARTSTHLDVRLPLDLVDLDVRCAALDVDPGWVPFLGRVVSFHYV